MSGSSSSRPNKVGLKKGGYWTSKLYFDPEADQPQKHELQIPDEELPDVGKRIDLDLREQKVRAIQIKATSHELSWRKTLSLRLNKDHFILRILSSTDPTDENWWSFELKDEGLKIYRDRGSEIAESNQEELQYEKVSPNKTINDLLEWLKSTKTYWRSDSSNCYELVSQLYYFIKQEVLEIPKPYNTCGGKWATEDGKYMVPFESSSCKYWLTETELKTKLTNLDGMKEVIKQVIACKTPLSEKQWSFLYFYHLFIVLQTDTYWWSAEKDGECIIFQRSKNKDDVKERCYQQPRVTGSYWKVKEINSDTSTTTIENLLQWIIDKKILDRKYHILSRNCKDFGRSVFDYVAQSDFLNM